MTEKITAAEARKISGPTEDELIQEELDFAYARIREAAKSKLRQAVLNNRFWTNGGYNTDPVWKKAVDELEKLGFEVRFHYEELQFVNMYTLVKW